MLPQAVQDSCAGQQQAAALRDAFRVETHAEVASALSAAASTAELTQWSEVAKSLNKGCFVEQDTATLLCGHLGVIMYVIANADIDHLQVTKCADPD
ncbi:TPA: hypothetical protein ACH3X1_013580 [Trebouxia sp. C0004]